MRHIGSIDLATISGGHHEDRMRPIDFIDSMGSTQNRTIINFNNTINFNGVTDNDHGSGSVAVGQL